MSLRKNTINDKVSSDRDYKSIPFQNVKFNINLQKPQKLKKIKLKGKSYKKMANSHMISPARDNDLFDVTFSNGLTAK